MTVGLTLVVHIHNALYTLLLLLPAAATAWLSTRVGLPIRPVRLASCFIVAAALALPAPYALVVAIAALLASRGAGRALVAGLCGAVAAQASAQAVLLLPTLAAAAIVYAALVCTVSVVDSILGGPRLRGRDALYELVNILAAAVLLHALAAGNPAILLSVLTLLVTAAYVLSALARAVFAAKLADAACASRTSELATLHAIGRELLATPDPERIATIVERECRKTFDVDFFYLGIIDQETHEQPRQNSLTPLGDGLAAWIVHEKRALRLDDASTGDFARPFRAHLQNVAVRSVLAVPLLVGERVLGVVSVQSLQPHAYDEHQLSLLATIAQQAAAAVANAHHHSLETIDSLTGLHLRADCLRRFEKEYARAKRYPCAFSILMLDLDGFKEINDRHGRLAGDRYLRALGATVTGRMRGADLACRYGGDEICILLPETNLAGARTIAERLRQAVARLVVDVPGASLRMTASIGLASYPEHDTGEIKGILLRADQSLYNAKRAGRDRVVAFSA